MKILIIGQSVEDHFQNEANEVIKPGGIYYTAASLNSFKEDDDEINLLTSVSANNYNLFAPVYENFNNSFYEQVDSIPLVYLTIHPKTERSERYKNITDSLKISVNDFSLYNGILINMITGFDISLETLKNIRNSFNGLIFLDVHTLSRGLDNEMNRNFRIIPGFDEWASQVDIIQVNENELKTLYKTSEKNEIIKKVFSNNIKIFILTKGERGARVYYKINDEIVSEYTSALKIKTKNKVGCGDVFGAIFFYTYIKTSKIFNALYNANLAAGFTASYDYLTKMNELKNDIFSRHN